MSTIPILLLSSVLVAGAFGKVLENKADCAADCKPLFPGRDPNNYLKIEVHTSWDLANSACTRYPGLPPNTFSLLTIDTKEEFDFMACYLKMCKDTDEYWTSGKYDANALKYVWDTTGEDVSMDSGFFLQPPPNPASPQTRVTIQRDVFGNTGLKTAQEEDGLISIFCEKKEPACDCP